MDGSQARAATGRRSLSMSPYLMLTLTMVFWSGNWIIGRALHETVPPMSLAMFRWVAALVFMLPFAWRHLVRDWPIVRERWKILVLLGVLGTAFQNALSYVGLRYTTAANGVILNSFAPVIIVTLSWVFLHERLRPQQALGVAISFAGVLALLSRGSLEALTGFRINPGDLVIMGNLVLWACYTLFLRLRPAELHVLSFLAAIGAVGVVSMVPALLVERALGLTMSFNAMNLLALAYLGVFPSFLAYVFWNRGVEMVGASVAGLFMHLMPVFGTLGAWLILGETLHAYHFAGMALILAGIYLTTRSAPRADPLD
jgi:drug/metabolite transporter (DMT)-like permease